MLAEEVCILQIGADHLDVRIDTVVDAMARLLTTIVGRTPRFRVRPHSWLPCMSIVYTPNTFLLSIPANEIAKPFLAVVDFK